MTPEQNKPQVKPERQLNSRWANPQRHATGKMKSKTARRQLMLEVFRKLSVLLLTSAAFTACQPTAPTVSSGFDALQARVSKLEAQAATNFSRLVEAASELDTRIERVEDSQRREAGRLLNNTRVHLDPTAKGFRIVETQLGRLLVMDTEAPPYLDGYAVQFKVGNQLAANISGCTITARWGPSFEFKGTNSEGTNVFTALEENLKRWRTNTFEMSETLLSGAWTKLELKITPADAPSIKNLTVELEPKSVLLRAASK